MSLRRHLASMHASVKILENHFHKMQKITFFGKKVTPDSFLEENATYLDSSPAEAVVVPAKSDRNTDVNLEPSSLATVAKFKFFNPTGRILVLETCTNKSSFVQEHLKFGPADLLQVI